MALRVDLPETSGDGVELGDPVVGAQLPGVEPGRAPLPGRPTPEPGELGVVPPVDAGQRVGDRPPVPDDLDEAGRGEGGHQGGDPPVVGDPLVDEHPTAPGPGDTPDLRPQLFEAGIGRHLVVDPGVGDPAMGEDRLSLHRHGKEALDEAAGGTVDVGVPAAGEPDRPLHVGQADGETVEPGQSRVAGEAAHPVRDVGGVGVQAQGLVQEARAGPGGTDQEHRRRGRGAAHRELPVGTVVRSGRRSWRSSAGALSARPRERR